MPRPSSLLAPLVCALAAPLPALAHDHWLEALPSRVVPGKASQVTLFVGEHFEQAEKKLVAQRSRYPRAEWISAAGRTDLRPALRENQSPLLEVTPTAPGSGLVALEAGPVEIELPADKWNAYLAEEHLDAIAQIRRARGESGTPGRERYTRSLKTIVQSGPTFDETPARPVGHEMEIVPDRNPSALRPGRTTMVGFRVLLRGAPLPRQSVTVATRAGSKVTTRSLITDGAGHAAFALDRPGAWMLRTVVMQRSTQPGADWRSYWASLTFDSGGSGASSRKR